MKIDTKCVHSGYVAGNGQPDALPIYQSTTYRYDSAEHVGKLFDLSEEGYFYTRLANPTVGYVEEKIADLEGGVGALLLTSGQAATMFAVLNIMGAGDHLVCASELYGGSINLFDVTLRKLGIDTTFVDASAPIEELRTAFKENTKAVFCETLANPALSVLDIEKFAQLAHEADVPLIIDNTFATPVLCKPFEYGADIVVHSTSKYMEGHGVQMGGAIVDGGTFDWTNGKFPGLSEPDPSYHGVVYTETFGKKAYITKARTQLMRDIGACPSAESAFLLNLGLETLPLRMEKHCANALKIAEYLNGHDKILSVAYPGLAGDTYHDLAKKYLHGGTSGVLSLRVAGGREGAIRFLDSLKLARIAVHVAMVRTCVLHPASSTHRQLTDEQLLTCGITPDLVRFSTGIEDADDLIADLKQALEKI